MVIKMDCLENVIVTGGTGLAGHGIQAIKDSYPLYSFTFLDSKTDLLESTAFREIVSAQRPSYIIHLAANVGGLFKNLNHNVEMFETNMLMNMNVLRTCHELGVKRLVSCLSTCIFPDDTTYPISEDMLNHGPPHPSNYGYSYSKRMLDVLSRGYRDQYGDDFITVIPTNMYGEYDNFNLKDAHVIPALIHKCHIAKLENKPFVVAGTGSPLRQFMYAQDFARVVLNLLSEPDPPTSLIVAPPESEVSIEYVARMIARQFNYEHRVVFDSSQSDGQYRKTADPAKLATMYPDFRYTPIDIGLERTVRWFLEHYPNIRL